MYIYFAMFSGMIGTCLSVLIRIELASPGTQILANDGQLFNTIVTAHAFLMIFFMVMPGLMGGFGNFFVPLLIGAVYKVRKIKEYNNCKYFSFSTNTNINNNFNSYLAGLFEGDGHIVLSKGSDGIKIKKVTIGITFNIKD